MPWDIDAVTSMPVPPEDWEPPFDPANAEEYAKVLIWVEADRIAEDEGVPWPDAWERGKAKVLEDMTSTGIIKQFLAYKGTNGKGKRVDPRKETGIETPADQEPGADPLNYIVELAHNNPGIVWDEQAARATPCIGYQFGLTPLVYSRGIVGALSEEQQSLYCQQTTWRDGPDLRQRVQAFQEAAATCKVQVQDEDPQKQWQGRVECMQSELRRRGGQSAQL